MAKDKNKKDCSAPNQNEPNMNRIGIVGGQAVLEGVMMKSGSSVSLAVRKEDGTIEVENSEKISLRKKYKICNIPIIRGCVNMVEQLVLGMNILTRSAEILGIEDGEPETKFEKWLDEKLGDKLFNIIMTIGTVLGLAIGVGLFVMLPSWVVKTTTGAIDNLPSFVKALIEGLMRILIFVGYVAACGLLKDIKRTYQYHGAEHKSVACFEKGLELTPENARKCTRFHPRCGTSFIFIILFISIIVNSFLTWDSLAIRYISKLITLPLIVGISFEFLMFAGKCSDNIIVKILSAPGMWIQRITTQEPDDKMLEVALEALKNAIPPQFEESTRHNKTEETAPKTETDNKSEAETDNK